MAKLTLLNMTQNILNAMSSSNVNSIDDTTEAMQVAEVIKETYLELMAGRDWPHLNRMFKMTALSNTSYPTTFQLPEDCSDALWIKYNKKTSASTYDSYSTVVYRDPTDFVELLNNRQSTATNVTQYNEYISGVPLNIITDTAPSYWTSFDNEYVVMDSFDSDLENTLQESKTQMFGVKNTEWTATDTFIPDLPEKMFPMLLAEAKSTCMLNYRQIDNRKEETKSRRQQNTMQHRSHRQNNNPSWKAYGRK